MGVKRVRSAAELDAAHIERYNNHPWLGRRDLRSWVRAAPDLPAPLVTSRLPDCLIHLARFATCSVFPSMSDDEVAKRAANPSAETVCGMLLHAPRWVPVGESSGFVCAACIGKAEAKGRPTFNMIPDTGCSVSGGKRGRRARGPRTE